VRTNPHSWRFTVGGSHSARGCYPINTKSPAVSRVSLSSERGVDASGVDFLPFPDLEQSVRDDVSTIKASPLLPPGIEVTGWIYDVKTGAISPVN
jgi:carbonic anhydrase